jgi:hypothetical protein
VGADLIDRHGNPTRIGYGQDWTERYGSPSSDQKRWTGRPRTKGKYLPLEIFWDPIIKVRDWKPWGFRSKLNWMNVWHPTLGWSSTLVGSGAEFERDALTRHGTLFGYRLFTYSVGCAANEPTHDLRKGKPTYGVRGTEEPFRYATNSRDMLASHKPSTWVASCLEPDSYEWDIERDYPSHFGYRDPVPGGWRFNVVHLDGHVDDARWMEMREVYSVCYGDYLFVQKTWFDVPYGWQFKTTEMPGLVDNAEDNLEPIPGFPRAYDCNK